MKQKKNIYNGEIKENCRHKFFVEARQTKW